MSDLELLLWLQSQTLSTDPQVQSLPIQAEDKVGSPVTRKLLSDFVWKSLAQSVKLLSFTFVEQDPLMLALLSYTWHLMEVVPTSTERMKVSRLLKPFLRVPIAQWVHSESRKHTLVTMAVSMSGRIQTRVKWSRFQLCSVDLGVSFFHRLERQTTGRF